MTNNRIIELAEQAGSTHKLSLGVYQFYTHELEQFANLLIQECIKVCKYRAGNSDYNTGRMQCASDIAEYFGMRTPGPNEPKMTESNNESRIR